LKVIQLPYCFHPDPVGGTELYVEVLARHLQTQGMKILIAAPATTNQTYHYQQLPVRRFALSPKVGDLRNLYGEGDAQAALEFSRILDTEKPDLIHLHAFTPGVSLRLVRAAKQRQIPVVFTYHTPTVSCQRGTLLQGGQQICNGKLDLLTCTRCTLQGLGLNTLSANLVGSLPTIVGKSLGALQLQGRIWTALRMSELVNGRQTAFHHLMVEVDHIIAVCNWVKAVLLLNQVPAEKITMIRQGLCHSYAIAPTQPPHTSHHAPLKIVFLGRLDRTKGVHVLIQALTAVPDLSVILDVYGISQVSLGDCYQSELIALANADARIHFHPSLTSAQVIATLATYDLLAVPSQWLETGPMVVLEAFAAGIPVLGSNLGGIAELVQSGVNGLLVEAASVTAWSQALQQLCQDRSLLSTLQAGISPPTNMAVVAERMRSIYRSVLQGRSTNQKPLT
jgi:glycosyltransferase involved in cell wall biosynthesis